MRDPDRCRALATGHNTCSASPARASFVQLTDYGNGTYSIDAGCKLLMNYTFGGVAYTWFGGLSYERNGATVMQTVPQGTALAGTLTRQDD